MTESEKRTAFEDAQRLLGRKRIRALALIHALSYLVAGRVLWALWALDWNSVTQNIQTLALLVLARHHMLLSARFHLLEARGLEVSLRAELVPLPGFEDAFRPPVESRTAKEPN